MHATPTPRGGEAVTTHVSVRPDRPVLVAVLCAGVLLAAACGDSGARPRDERSPQGRASAALSTTSGTAAHDLYASKGFTCATCHPCGTKAANGHQVPWMDPANAGFHAASANANIASCQTCHGPDLDGIGGSTAVSCAQCHGATWKTNCTMCHGGVDGTSGAPPKTTWGNSGDAVRVGTHTSHVAATHALSRPVGCVLCHPVPVDALSPGHLDGATATVTFSGLAAQIVPDPGPSWNRAQATCTSTYCHGATLSGGVAKAPTWTASDGTARACDACHGAPPPAPHVRNTDCGNCHPGYTPNAVNVALHVDGKVDLRADITCTTCHGSIANAAPPLGTGGETLTTQRAVGAHQVHLAGSAIKGPLPCTECHLVPAGVNHADGVVQLPWGPLASANGAQPSFNADLTCANYCHGQTLGAGGLLTTPLWTRVDGTQAACGTCHGAPPPSPHPDNVECGRCHPGYTATTIPLDTHVNGQLEVEVSCSSCHGSALNAAPPKGLHDETSETSRAVGAHQRHLSGGPLRGPMQCSDCHLVPTAMNHSDGTIQLPFGPLAWAQGATPTWDPLTLTCSGTYCHGARLRGSGTNQAPVWTGGASQTTCGTCHLLPPPAPHPHTQVCDNCHPGYTTTSVNLATHINGLVEAENLTCSSCHGDDSRVLVMQADPNAIAAPPFGSRGETEPTSRSVGQHQAHVNRGDGIALPSKCRYCHVVPTTFDHANGESKVTFGSLATMDGATPTFDEATNTCSNTYCHGSTLGRGGTDHDPSWTNPAPVTCTSCHGAPPPLPHPQESDCIRCHPGYTATTVRKWTHVNGISDFPSGCNSCHDTPPNTGAHYEHLQERITCDRCHAGYTPTSANPTLHRNARQDVTLSGWNPSTRTCSNIGCHGSEYWGRVGSAARTSCNQCHGVPPSSGEHYEHKEYSCSRCHGTGYSTTTNNPATHMNGVTDVPFSFYDRSTHSCSSGTGACHGSKSWGTPSPVTPNCSNCHGFPPPLPHPQQNACQGCHPSMLSTGVLTTDHNNGTLDISGAGCASCHGFPPTITRAGGVHVSDPNCYGCHSTTVDAANQVVPNGTHNDGYVQVGGGGVGTYGCQTCHGDQARQAPAGADPNVKAAPPFGTRGEVEPTTRAVGAHLAHVSPAAETLAGPALCAECHVVPTSMDHALGAVVMSFGPRAAAGGAFPVWDPATLTCSSTYCHGSTLNAGGTSHVPTWTGGAAEAACGTCHAVPPPAPHTASTSCGSCHAGYTQTSVNLATHVDGIVQVTSSHPAGYADKTRHGYDANLQGLAGCKECHGADLNGGTGPSCTACHTSAGFSNWATNCTFCHGSRTTGRQNPPVDIQGRSATTNVSVGVHEAHATTTIANAVACTECHPARTASVVTDAGHMDGNGIAEIAFGTIARTGNVTPTYTRTSATAATCASTYCHGKFSGGTNATVGWTSTTQVGCTSCHGLPPSTGRHDRHTSRSCGDCHGSGYTTSAVVKATHVDGIEQVGNRITSYNRTTRTCTSTCHGSETW